MQSNFRGAEFLSGVPGDAVAMRVAFKLRRGVAVSLGRLSRWREAAGDVLRWRATNHK